MSLRCLRTLYLQTATGHEVTIDIPDDYNPNWLPSIVRIGERIFEQFDKHSSQYNEIPPTEVYDLGKTESA